MLNGSNPLTSTILGSANFQGWRAYFVANLSVRRLRHCVYTVRLVRFLRLAYCVFVYLKNPAFFTSIGRLACRSACRAVSNLNAHQEGDCSFVRVFAP